MTIPVDSRPWRASCLVTGVRLVRVGGEPRPGRGGGEVVDVRIREGLVTQVRPALSPDRGEAVHDGGGRWLVPGLWDQHVHLQQVAMSAGRLDLAGTAGPQECLDRVAAHLATLPAAGPGAPLAAVQGWGHRSATWPRRPTVAELDAVTGVRPVVLISGDGHHGWLNSAALAWFGLPPRDGVLDEAEWFPVFHRLGDLPGAAAQAEAAYDGVLARLAARGLVGITDMELAANHTAWPARFAAGADTLRVRGATYADGLARVLELGLRTGDPLPGGGGMLTMGPLKIIADGSLNTRTAYCCEPYADDDGSAYPRGKQNVAPQELRELLARADAGDLTVAVHAIGDAAVSDALDAFETTGARGSIEHAQLMRRDDVARMGRLGVGASTQPAHLLDDRDVALRCWPDRMDRCYPHASMLAAGVDVRFGSDAPVAPADPWLAMAAAVHRSADDREPWASAEALTPAQALAASTDGQGTVAVGSRGDLALLDDDPLAVPAGSREAGAYLRGIRVAATLVAGRLVYAA